MKNRENVVSLDSWTDVLEALQTDYTMSLKDVCQLLKSSRPWVNTYIKPFVRSIYLTRVGKVSYVKLASLALGRPDMTESVWLHRGDVEEFLRNAVATVTKQAKSIPVTFFIPESNLQVFHDEREALRDALKNTGGVVDVERMGELLGRYKELVPLFARADVDKARLYDNQVQETARGKVPATSVPLPEDYLKHLQAPHDLKDYGDVDETIYRRLFSEGSIRIEMQFTAKDGNVGKKVFYVDDPEPIHTDYPVEGYVTVSEVAWEAYNRGMLYML